MYTELHVVSVLHQIGYTLFTILHYLIVDHIKYGALKIGETANLQVI